MGHVKLKNTNCLCISLIHKKFLCIRKLNAILACVRAYLYGKKILSKDWSMIWQILPAR